MTDRTPAEPDMPTASYVCECGERFTSEMQLQDHARDAHGALDATDVESYRCPECQAVLGTRAELLRHQEAHADREARDENRR